MRKWQFLLAAKRASLDERHPIFVRNMRAAAALGLRFNQIREDTGCRS